MPPKFTSGLISADQRSEFSASHGLDRQTPGRSAAQPNRHIQSNRRTANESRFRSPTRTNNETQAEAKAVYWGTNIDERTIEAKFEKFLRDYKDAGVNYYMHQMHNLAETDEHILFVEGVHLHQFDSFTYKQLIQYPAEIVPIFDNVAQRLFYDAFLAMKGQSEQERDELRILSQRLIIGITGLKKNIQVRELNPRDINKLISVTGIVIRCSELYPEMKQATFKCTKCGHLAAVNVDRGRVEEPVSCASCRDKNSYQIIHNLCQYTDKQYVKLQEQPEKVPEGYTPQTVSLMPYDDNVDEVKPGDRVTVIGVYRANAIRQMKTRRTLKSVYNTFIDVISYQKETKVDSQKMKQVTEEQQAKLFAISQSPNIYDRLIKSVAPSIWGQEDIKQGVLCQLFGGTPKDFTHSSRGRFRADINILLVGDPSTSKSQILKSVHSLSDRGLYTSGKGSSAVGLTVYVSRDPETGEIVLESGALVLSDKGICCIDEFDKMDDNAKTILHEAMEQQTISVAKAGIVSQLNSRTSILAAANPIKSRYDSKQSVVQNINMPPTILSRFDLIYLVLDEQNEQKDKMLAYHILNLYSLKTKEEHRKQLLEEGDPDLIDRDTLFKYIFYAKHNIKPRLSEEAQDALVEAYKIMRNAGGSKNVVTATPRQLESLIRLSEAWAKMQFNQIVEAYHVKEALNLIDTAMKKAAMDPITGQIDMDLLATGRSGASRDMIQKLIEKVPLLIKSRLQEYRGAGVRFYDFIEQVQTELFPNADDRGKNINREILEALALLEEQGIVQLPGDRNKPRVRAGPRAVQ